MVMNVGGRDCVPGFDWSMWQPPVDLAPAAHAGERFMVVKATEGTQYRDGNYSTHVANAVAAELLVGGYHFARPDWSSGSPHEDGQAEARMFLSVVDDRIKFAVLDLEATELDAPNTTQFVLGWLDAIEESGRFPGRSQRLIYVGKFFNWQHTAAVANRACLWIPWYTAGFEPNVDPTMIGLPGWSSDLWPEGWCVWQYSSSGTVAGIHPSDVNVATAAWFDSVCVEQDMDHPPPFPTPEVSDMARPIYKFPEGDPNPNSRFTIDLRSGMYQTQDGKVGQGLHWYHMSDEEVFLLTSNREINPADCRYLSVAADDPLHPGGGPALDALYAKYPLVYGS